MGRVAQTPLPSRFTTLGPPLSRPPPPSPQGEVLASLEAAALDTSMDPPQRAALASSAALPMLQGGEARGAAEGGYQQQGGADELGLQQQQQQHGQPTPWVIEVATPASGWLSVLPICAGFIRPTSPPAPPLATAGTGGPTATTGSSSEVGSGVWFAAAVWNALPVALPLAGVELELSDVLGPLPPLHLLPTTSTAPAAAAAGGGGGGDAAAAQGGSGSVALQPGAWQRVAGEVAVRRAGQVQAVALTLWLGTAGKAAAAGGQGGLALRYALPALLAAPPQRHPAAQQAPGLVGWLPGGWEANTLPFSTTAG